jgi:hypothetical protein
MPKYQIELTNGKKYVVEADQPPTEAEVMASLKGGGATPLPAAAIQGMLPQDTKNSLSPGSTLADVARMKLGEEVATQQANGEAAWQSTKEHPFRTAAIIAAPEAGSALLGAASTYGGPLVRSGAKLAANVLDHPVINGGLGAYTGYKAGGFPGAVLGGVAGSYGARQGAKALRSFATEAEDSAAAGLAGRPAPPDPSAGRTDTAWAPGEMPAPRPRPIPNPTPKPVPPHPNMSTAFEEAMSPGVQRSEPLNPKPKPFSSAKSMPEETEFDRQMTRKLDEQAGGEHMPTPGNGQSKVQPKPVKQTKSNAPDFLRQDVAGYKPGAKFNPADKSLSIPGKGTQSTKLLRADESVMGLMRELGYNVPEGGFSEYPVPPGTTPAAVALRQRASISGQRKRTR